MKGADLGDDKEDWKAEAKGDGEFASEYHLADTLPHESPDCESGVEGPDGKCMQEEAVKELLEQKSNEAVKNLASAAGDPKAQVQAQEDLAKIQEQRVEQAVKDTEDIKEILKKKRRGKKGKKGWPLPQGEPLGPPIAEHKPGPGERPQGDRG